ncbi:MAG: hypothetical protein VYA34_03120 [Myxococcota bacterium]|nr:hypothetical protein [Myxococcota bacterium]
MADWNFTCWSCSEVTEMHDKVTRGDECPHCRNDMRACKNCQYYSPGSHNECSETISEYIPDKERSNFCGMYRPFEGEREEEINMNDAKAKLEALFKK